MSENEENVVELKDFESALYVLSFTPFYSITYLVSSFLFTVLTFIGIFMSWKSREKIKKFQAILLGIFMFFCFIFCIPSLVWSSIVTHYSTNIGGFGLLNA